MAFVHIPPLFTHLEAIAFWIIFVWAFGAERAVIQKAAAEGRDDQDEGTMRLILVGNMVAMAAAFIVAFLPWLNISWPRVALAVGAVLMLAGGLLRRACFRALGEHFSGLVRATADQPVIDSGPYRWVRHPSYTAGFLLFLGIGFGLGSWLSIVILFGAAVYVYARRVAVEERVLLATIGEPYREYMQRTTRFIPGVF
jgi:protein-S-isoprenylcysteine O-methyltransferase Ste14